MGFSGRGGGRGGLWGRTQYNNFEEVEADEDEEAQEIGRELGGSCEYAAADDSSDTDAADDELAQKMCLPVSGGPLPPSDEPPKDADEYLRRVQWERMHVPETVDVEVDEKHLRRRKQKTSNRGSLLARFDAPEVPESIRHSSEWTEDVVSAFRDLRARCQEMKQMSVEASGDNSEGSLSYDAWKARCADETPSTAFVASQDVVSVHRLLVAAVDAVVAAHEVLDAASPAPQEASAVATAVDQRFGADGRLAQWAFAALAFIEEPLVDDIQYNLQRLRRACQKGIVAAHERAEAGAESFDKGAHAQACLLLAIVTEVFGQR